MAEQSCNVVVIGAGFAGLSAARTLREGGLSAGSGGVVVLEAADRVGGRAHTPVVRHGLAVELGCTWIHGTISSTSEPNPVLAAATAAGLMPSQPRRQRWWASRFLLPGLSDCSLTSEQELVVHKAVEAYAAAVESADPGGGYSTVGAALNAAWTQFSDILSSEEEKKIAAAAWAWREQLQRAIDGCDTTSAMETRARAVYSEFGDSEVHAPVPCGYQAVAEALAEGLGPGAVLLGQAVTSVDWGGAAGVRVTCANGEVYTADSAVVTASIGYLKSKHTALFSPPLPAKKVEALGRLEIGTVDKIVVDFGDAEDKSQEFAENEEIGQPDEGVVTYALLWDDDVAQGLPEWARAIFSVRFGGPEFKRRRGKGSVVEEREESDDSEEDEESAPLSGPPVHRQAVMWLTGEEARQAEEASDEEVLETVRAVVERFPGVMLPAGAEWATAQLVRSRWGADPFIGGSYSYVGPNGSPDDVAALAEPLRGPDGRVRVAFAGEACHLRYIGTTHAAMLTGQQAAYELLRNDIN